MAEIEPMLESTTDGAQAIIDVAQQAVAPHKLEPGHMYAVAVPDGGRVDHIYTDSREPYPARSEGSVDVHRAASFIDYVNRHNSTAVVLWANIDVVAITAVLNDHLGTGGVAGWRDFTATLGLRRTPAWRDWIGRNGQAIGQLAFAEFVEDHLPDIVNPPGADLLELAQSFQAVKRATFSSDKRLASGQVQLTYHEEVDATAGRGGSLEVPSVFTVAIAPFEGTDPVAMTARLRYRINAEAQLLVSFHLDRPEEVLRTAFEQVVQEVAGGTSLPVWFGDPQLS